jgi:hypothetical protein
MRLFKNSLWGVFFFFIFIDLCAKELELIKQETESSVKFSYQFYDFLSQPKEVAFELDKDLIQEAIEAIPSLETLHQKIHTELPRIAYEIAKEQFAPIEDDYYHHLSDVEYAAIQAERNLGEGFELIYECPKQIVDYSLEFTKTKKFGYKISSQINSCSFQTSTEKAYQNLIEKIGQSIEKVKRKLPEKAVYKIEITAKGYQTSSKIPGGLSKKVHERALNAIKNNQKNIENWGNTFEEKSNSLKESFQQVVAANKTFIAAAQKQQSQILKNILQDIALKQDEEYYQYFLKVEKTKQGNVIGPDYKKIVLTYRPFMNKVANALNDSDLEERALANKILNFLQAIKYNDLKKRDLEYFSGFLTPPALFYENRGDCDTKSVAFLSIAKNLFLNTKAILVLVPGHAFIGLELQAQAKDATLEHGGIKYVLAETAGPGVLPFGKVGAQSLNAIKKNDIEEVIVF